MRLRRLRGTILGSVLISAAFIAEGLTGGEPPSAEPADGGASLTRDAEDRGTTGGTGRGASLLNGLGWGGGVTGGMGLGSPRAIPGSETGGSRMGGNSRLGGNSVHGLDTGSAGTSGSGLGDTGRPSIF